MGTLSVRELIMLAMDKVKVVKSRLVSLKEIYDLTDSLILLEEALREIDDGGNK